MTPGQINCTMFERSLAEFKIAPLRQTTKIRPAEEPIGNRRSALSRFPAILFASKRGQYDLDIGLAKQVL